MSFDVTKELAELAEQTASLKRRFEAFITDTSLPLEQRWEAFKRAPSSMKNEKGWVEDFKAIPKEVSWYNDFYKERHETVHTDDIVERIEEDVQYSGGDFSKSKLCKSIGVTPEALVALKEEILQKNLGSFIYDW